MSFRGDRFINGNDAMKPAPYAGRQIILPTQHAKAQAIAPVFADILNAQVREHACDTDSLGTFSGEVERRGTALDAARRKVQLAFTELDADLAVASEGSFGPHPTVGFVPADQELLHFADRSRDFSLTVTLTTTDTNYRMADVTSLDALVDFAQKAGFPTHGLILATQPRDDPHRRIIKGIQTHDALAEGFSTLRQVAQDGKIWVETDMRACFNPTRMTTIAKLAEKLAQRLATPCPACDLPGWGEIDVIEGLPCAWCGMPTPLVRGVIHGCVTCTHRETRDRPDGLKIADPGHCPRCNP